MYYTTGFSRCEIQDLCVLIEEIQSSIPEADRRDWPPILALGNSVVITLTYLRRNRVQWELAETYGVSQATVSRAITSITPLLARALARYVPTAEELRSDRQYIVDGTLLPCWSWASDAGLYSGKHKTTGMNVQVVCTLEGELAWISDPVAGARHDVYCLDQSGALDGLTPDAGPATRAMSDAAWSRPSRRSRASNSSTGRRRSTRPSIRPALWSNASSPTSKPGEFSTPTTGDRWARSTQQSPQLSGYSSTRWREMPLNKPRHGEQGHRSAPGK